MEESAQIAKLWLKECLTNHESCQKRARLCHVFSTDNAYLISDLGHDDMMPRRLLEFSLGAVDGVEDIVKLIEFGKTTEQSPYIALSWRWGGKADCVMNRSNIQSLQTKGILFTSLPKTFQDAVTVTRKLGYTRLWIDALCIIQNDREDWKMEGTRMATVYGNAECTIAAVDAPNNDSGLSPVSIPDEERGGLNLRAWVCQERMISPRTLSFADNSISWECRHCDASQKSPDLKPRLAADIQDSSLHPKEIFAIFRDFRSPGHRQDPAPGNYKDAEMGLVGEPSDYTVFMRAWWQFISMYTACGLTVESDKFLAMHGIAAVPQRWTSLRNSWGLWRHFLEKDLTWYIDPDFPVATRPKGWLAPHWSWASTVGGRVVNKYYETLPSFPRLMLKPQIGVPVGTSFDQILPLIWRKREHHGITLHGDLRPGKVVTTLDKNGKKVYTMNLEPVGRWSEEEEHDFRPDVAGEFEVGTTVDVQCLLFFHYDKGHLGLENSRDIRLVLEPAPAWPDFDPQSPPPSPTDSPLRPIISRSVPLLKYFVRPRGADSKNHPTQEITPVVEWTAQKELVEKRTMCRTGYLETTYVEQRDMKEVFEETWWKYVRLV